MFDDDYDPNALAVLKKHLLGQARQINYYGLPGRHNDDSSGMIKWFLRQYARVLKEDFGR
ncbi:accessory Sec system protein Asp2 [Limosilactobacillus mucosae]|nr:accessory Sec system protein Asp2 [Limosilactobacillus mucosae]